MTGILKEPKLAWAGGGWGWAVSWQPVPKEAWPILRLDGKLGLGWGLCFLGKGNIYKVYICFVLISFVAIQLICVILITKRCLKIDLRLYICAWNNNCHCFQYVFITTQKYKSLNGIWRVKDKILNRLRSFHKVKLTHVCVVRDFMLLSSRAGYWSKFPHFDSLHFDYFDRALLSSLFMVQWSLKINVKDNSKIIPPHNMASSKSQNSRQASTKLLILRW